MIKNCYFLWRHSQNSKIFNKKLEINSVYLNQDYTGRSIKRDNLIKTICEKYNVLCNFCDDILLNLDSIMKDDGQPYSTFTNYHQKASKLKVLRPDKKLVTSKFVNVDSKLFS